MNGIFSGFPASVNVFGIHIGSCNAFFVFDLFAVAAENRTGKIQVSVHQHNLTVFVIHPVNALIE